LALAEKLSSDMSAAFAVAIIFETRTFCDAKISPYGAQLN
jgi:hypothetical protein